MTKQFPEKLRIACFVSSHGFGHATRVSAILQQISKKVSYFDLVLFGHTPPWFWELNLPKNCTFSLEQVITDIGLVQKDPFRYDIACTLDNVLDFVRFTPKQINSTISAVKNFRPNFILCDISPLGIKIGNQLGIPTVLVENFTWDWIYRPFLNKEKRFEDIIKKLKKLYSHATFRLQCTPFCESIIGTTKVNPVYRDSDKNRNDTLSKLGIGDEDKYILLTTGGISMKHSVSQASKDYYIVIPGSYQNMEKIENIIHLPMNTNIPFPNLVHSASWVVGKAGYGTISECWGMQVPFIGVFREWVRESEILKKFCQKNLNFREISMDDFLKGLWWDVLDDLPPKNVNSSKGINGAIEASEAILDFIFNGQ